MQIFIRTIAIIGLVLTIVPSFFVFSGKTSMTVNYNLMMIGMILWFVSAPFWKKKA
jgi:hypothetical protein